MAPWNDTEDRRLLLAIVQATSPAPNWDEIALKLGKTRETVRQRYQKLKKTVTTPSGDTSAAPDDKGLAPALDTATDKVRKRGTAQPADSSRASPAKKPRGPRVKKEVVTDDDDEDEAFGGGGDGRRLNWSKAGVGETRIGRAMAAHGRVRDLGNAEAVEEEEDAEGEEVDDPF